MSFEEIGSTFQFGVVGDEAITAELAKAEYKRYPPSVWIELA